MMKISKEFILREIAGEYILVPVGKTALTFNGLVTVNEVGAHLGHAGKRQRCQYDRQRHSG